MNWNEQKAVDVLALCFNAIIIIICLSILFFSKRDSL